MTHGQLTHVTRDHHHVGSPDPGRTICRSAQRVPSGSLKETICQTICQTICPVELVDVG